MPSARSRSLLTALVVAPIAVAPVTTGCFLRGDYKLEEETVLTPGLETSEEPTSSAQPTSVADVTPTQPAVAPPPPTGNPVGDGSSSETSTTALPTHVSSDGTAGAEPATSVGVALESAPTTTSQGGGNSEARSSSGAGETNGWRGSDNDWWDSSGRCYRQGQGNCDQECDDGEIAGPEGRCYWFDAGQGTWSQAKSTCSTHGQGWVPIAIHNDEEDTFMSVHLNHEAQTWLGAQYSTGSWRWLDDNTAFWAGPGRGMAIDGVFSKWGTREPSASPGETCGRVESFNNDMRWGDSECNQFFRIACQSPLP